MGTYLVMINNLKRSFNHKLLFIVTFLLPVVVCILFGLIDFGKVSLRIGILEPEKSGLSIDGKAELCDLLEQSEGILYAAAEEDSLNTDIMMGQFQIVLDYRESRVLNQFEMITYQPEDKKTLIQMAFQEAITDKQPIYLGGLKKEGLSVTERSAAILLSLFLVFAAIQAAGMIRDKQSGTFARYKFAMKSSNGYFLGYTLHTFLITFLQVLLCIGVLLVLQEDFLLTFMEGLVLSITITALSTIYAVVICNLSKSEVQANIIASGISAIMSLLGGTFVAIEAMPGLLRILSLTSPIRWVVELLKVL